MKRRQANKIVRKHAGTDLQWKKITIFNAYQNATAEAYFASARKRFERLVNLANCFARRIITTSATKG